MHKVENKKLLTLQNIIKGQSHPFRHLTDDEIDILIKQNNHSPEWNKVFIRTNKSVHYIVGCQFYGYVYIGNFHRQNIDGKTVSRPQGLYGSSFENSFIGDDCALHNIGHLSGYVIGQGSLISNTGEISCSAGARFGMGERLEIINENGGRSISIFRDITTGDAYLWARHRSMAGFFEDFTKEANKDVGAEPGVIGPESVIKNCGMIHDCRIGEKAFIHECSSLDNLTILSSRAEPTELGEGIGLNHGLIGYANHITGGVRAQNFISGRNVSITNGARIGHTFIGDNSHISCAEVMNNLLFPFHEQHHNNSFLIASTIGGQANIAAGATIGSNHNSRAADGEIWADRGFWPGLATDFKHNSKFASFALIAKASYGKELNVPFPFSLVGRSPENGALTIMPGYWFKYNMYALARNAWKFKKRDKRVYPQQIIETNFMAPDTLIQMYVSIQTLLKATDGKALSRVSISGISPGENTLIVKPSQGIELYRKMIHWHTAQLFVETYGPHPELLHGFNFSPVVPDEWENIGGQIIRAGARKQILGQIESGDARGWDFIHAWYKLQDQSYNRDHLKMALDIWALISDPAQTTVSVPQIKQLLTDGMNIGEQILLWARESREKDFRSAFRIMCYDDDDDMNNIMGRVEENPFLIEMQQDHLRFCDRSKLLLNMLTK